MGVAEVFNERNLTKNAIFSANQHRDLAYSGKISSDIAGTFDYSTFSTIINECALRFRTEARGSLQQASQGLRGC
jgi:hypothetical protein